MNLKTFARLGRRGRRWVWGGALTGLLLAAGTTAIGDVSPEAKRSADQRRESLSLFSGPTAVLQGNQLQCGIINFGSVCTNVFNSPTGGGGFWPTGSQNQYIFNTGLQVAGIMGPEAGPWANDTVGAFFFDASGTVPSGTELTDVYDSLNPDDLDNWPSEAFVSDPDLFQPVLVGRKTASQQDSWVQYWDGDPARISGRQHPMGLTVTQRSLAWNYPAGNESLIYFLYKFRNTTAASDPQGSEFQRLNEAQFFAGNNALPDGGISFSEMYAAFSTDMDVTSNAGQNFSTAVLPFDLGISYHGGFSAPEFTYFPELFFPPFFTNAPGLIGVKYLKSPINPETGNEVGLTLFSATLNSSTGFPDPRTDKQLWRYLSGKVDPAKGDFPCNITPEVTSADPTQVQRSLCFLFQTAADTRFYQASGPFAMQPGDEATIVVAYIAAATVATLPDGSPSGILANSSDDSANPPGEPSFHPGYASARGCPAGGAIPADCTETQTLVENEVKPLERGAGWVSYSGPAPASALESPANKLDQRQVQVVPGSLLGKALVAQTIFDSRFLLGFAPEQPTFYLVPGNNQVTVVWDKSATETNGEGDPFFAVASDPGSALYNPNYRQFDVEGYRVWRGTSSGSLTLIAQFDYGNTSFTDTTCETVAPTEDLHDNSSAPTGTIGYVAGEDCPADFSKTSGINRNLVFNNGGAGGNPGNGVYRLADGSAAYNGDPIVAIESDEGGAKLPLSDNGVPGVYVDEGVVNNFTYFYAVSAFDVNSPASGPHTLRSARVAQSVVPRADAPNVTNAELAVNISGDDGVPLNPNAPNPSIDSEDGTFAGPFPPTNSIELGFAPLVPRLLAQFSLSATIDSIVPTASPGSSFGTPTPECAAGGDPFSKCLKHYVSIDRNGSVTQTVIDVYNPWWASFGENPPNTFTLVAAEIPFDQDALDAFGIPSGSGNATAIGTYNEALNNGGVVEGPQNRRFGREHGGSRWFSGSNESVADPTAYVRMGHLDGVDTVWAPIGYTAEAPGDATPSGQEAFEKQCFSRALGAIGRAADVQFTWSGGGVDVRDVVHHVEVPFKPSAQSSYGFLNTDANGNGFLDWQDFNYVDGALQILRLVGGGNCDAAAGTSWDPGSAFSPVSLEQTPTMMPVSTQGLTQMGVAGLASTGMGFGLYINGERYIFQVSDVPADGTVWTLRTYSGSVHSSDDQTGATDPGGYSYVTDEPGNGTGQRPAIVAGLKMNWSVAEATNFKKPADLTQVHTVPDPYLGSSLYDRAPTSKQLMFVNLPPEATIRIYTLTGILVDVLVHDDVSGGGREVWNMRNRNNQFVASGVYFFHVMTPSGDAHVGKFTVVMQAGSN